MLFHGFGWKFGFNKEEIVKEISRTLAAVISNMKKTGFTRAT